MKILGKEIEFSFTDVDFIEKTDNELNKIKDLQDKKFDSYMEELKYTCTIIKDFFSNIFNEDFSNVKNDYVYLLEEFDSFNSKYIEKTKEANEKLNKKFSKYDLKRVKR